MTAPCANQTTHRTSLRAIGNLCRLPLTVMSRDWGGAGVGNWACHTVTELAPKWEAAGEH